MELQPLKIRFYLKQKTKGSDDYSLYMRMLLSGKRTDISLSYSLKKNAWDDKNKTLKKGNPDYSFILNLTNKYRQRAQEVYLEQVLRDLTNDVNILRQKITGTGKDISLIPTLLKMFDRIIDRKKSLAGQNNTVSTVQKYNCCKKHLESFIKKNFSSDDMKLSHISLQFIEDFELYLKTEAKCSHNTTMKYIRTLKTVFKTAWSYGYTDKDPFQKYKIRLEEVVRTYLSEKEIKNLLELDLTGNKLSRVRDWFLFSCFTGLAYIDLKNLCAKHIQLENGKYWIRTRRQKTNVKTNVPILDLPLQIIKRYCPDFECRNGEDKIFRVISNQKINAYLKELAKYSGITKTLTFHLSRHTFATTITLNNGVPIESVSSMLGHKNIATTQHYAKLLDKKLEEDMENLGARLKYGKPDFMKT